MGPCQTSTQASKDRMETLRRKLSNAPGSDVPMHPVPGAFSIQIVSNSPGIMSAFWFYIIHVSGPCCVLQPCNFKKMSGVDCFLGAPHIAQQAASKPFSAGATLVGKPVWTDRQLESHEQETQVQETLTVPAPPTPEAPTPGSLPPFPDLLSSQSSVAAPADTSAPPPAHLPEPAAVTSPPPPAHLPEPAPKAPHSATLPKQGPSTLTSTPGSATLPAKPLSPVIPATSRAEAEAVTLTPPEVGPEVLASGSSSVTPTEPEDFDESASQAVPQQPNKRDPSYWRLRRYFTPRANGTLKCSPEAMKLWHTAEGSFQVWSWICFISGVRKYATGMSQNRRPETFSCNYKTKFRDPLFWDIPL